jgi:hypothetical protein
MAKLYNVFEKNSDRKEACLVGFMPEFGEKCIFYVDPLDLTITHSNAQYLMKAHIIPDELTKQIRRHYPDL